VGVGGVRVCVDVVIADRVSEQAFVPHEQACHIPRQSLGERLHPQEE